MTAQERIAAAIRERDEGRNGARSAAGSTTTAQERIAIALGRQTAGAVQNGVNRLAPVSRRTGQALAANRPAAGQRDALTAALLGSVGLTAKRPTDNDFAARAYDNQRKYADLTVSTPDTDPAAAWRRTRGTGVIRGGGYGSAAGAVNFGGMALDTAGHVVDAAETNRYTGLKNSVATYQKVLETGRLTDGKPLTAAARKTVEDYLARSRAELADMERPAPFAQRHPLLSKATQSLYDTADTLAERSGQEIAMAKEGLGAAGQFAVDAGVAGTQLLGDMGIGLLTGGGALPAMFVRSAGGGAQEARQSGAGFSEQLGYGVSSGLLSVATEKISNVAAPFAKVFGKGFADDLVTKLTGRLGSTAAGRLALSAISEGGEEFIEDVFQPVLQRATYDPDARFDLSQALYDAAIGAVLGGLGGGVEMAGSAMAQHNGIQDTAGTQTARRKGMDTPTAREGVQAPHAPAGSAEAVFTGPRLGLTEAQKAAPETGTASSDRDTYTVVQKLKESIPALSQEAPVAGSSVQNVDAVGGSTMAEKARKLFEAIKGIVVRPGFGDVEINGRSVKDDLSHGIGPAKAAVITAVPEVIRRGQQIHVGENWKGRGYDGYVFAAPVMLDGQTAYVAAVVKRTSKNRFYLHEVVDSNGNIIKIDSGDKATPTSLAADGDAGAKSPLSVEGTRPLDSDVSIPQGADAVNPGGVLEAEARRLYGRPVEVPLQADGTGGTMEKTAGQEETYGRGAAQADQAEGESLLRDEGRRSGVHAGAEESDTRFLEREHRQGRTTRTADGIRYGYRPVSVEAQSDYTRQIVSELQSLGVEAFAYDGELRANVNGLTVRDTGEAATLRDGSVGVPNRSAGELTPKEIAAHEAYHSMSRRGVSEAAAFSRAVEEHVLVSSELAEAYIGDISDNYFNGKYNRNDPRHRQKLLDELCAYLSGDLYEAAVDVSGMFDDYGAVKAAWERMMGTARQSGGDGLGAAEAGEMGSFTRMQNESETFHPVNLQAAQTTERMRGRAPEEVPVINPRTGRPVSKTVSTILNSPLTSNDMAVEIEGAVADGTFDYVPVTDRDAHARAQRSLSREGLQAVAARFFAKIELGQRITKADMAEGIAAYNQAVETGDRMTAFQLMSSIADAAHDGAQVTQAMNLMNRLTPEGRLLTLRRYVDRLNDRASTRPSRRAAPAAADPEAARADYVERATGFAVSDELASAYLLAETDAERAAAWDAITTDLAGQIPSTFREKADFWRYTSMLLNPTTHARNFLGNAIQAGARKIKNGVGAAIERAAVRDRRARTKSLLNPMGKEDRALTAFARERYAADQRAAMGAGKYTDGSAAGIGREIQEKRRTFQGKNPVSRAVQAAGDFNTRLLDAEDVLFNRPAYVESFAQALKAKGVTAEEAASGAKADLVEAARAYAIEEAQRATYRNTTALSDTLSRLGRYNPEANAVEKAGTFIADALLPFRRTPANILTTGLDYSPLGFAKGVKEALLDVRQGKCTAADAVDALASGLTGTGILAVGAYLAAEGIFGATLHVRAGDDDREEAFNKSAGIQGYALRIGDKSYTLDWALPAAMPLFAGAAIMESAREGGSTLEGVLDAMTGISEVVLETSMLSSLNDLISNWSYADNKITYLLDRAASSYAGQYAPTLGGKVASALDDTVRKSYVEKGTGQAASDADYFLQSILKKIPGARKTLQPAVDLWGREVSNGSAGERVFQSFLSPGYLKTVDDGPVDRELRRLHAATGSSAVYPAEAEKSFTVHGETKYLTAEEYTKYAKTLGKTRYDAVTALVNNAGYKKLSDEEKARAVSDAYEYAKVIGKQAVSRYKPADSSFAKGAMNSVLPIDSYILYQINADRDRSGGVTSVESAETLWELSGVSDRQRGDAWRQKNSATSPEKNPFTGALPAAGVDTKTAIAVLDQYRTLNNSEGMRPREKAAAFKRYVNGLGLTKEQVRAVQDTYTFFGSYPVSW